jgi:ubiquinone/menaquinone biosynthesis C-methylase UbiE
MDEFKPDPTILQNGVYILTEIQNDFESIYLKVREREKRVYSHNELQNLPFVSYSIPHQKEWEIRARSFSRFKRYLESKKTSLNILDLGCGNGWFSGQLSKSFNHKFYCVDVNITELKQGRKVFESENLIFIYADIFSTEFPTNYFDIVMLNASIQYFSEINTLFTKLLSLIKVNGEIHIIDSPIYPESEVENAKKRTQDYYNSIGFSEMINNYYHRSWNEFLEYNFKIMYNPNPIKIKVKKLFSIKDSPFPWIRIKNGQS